MQDSRSGDGKPDPLGLAPLTARSGNHPVTQGTVGESISHVGHTGLSVGGEVVTLAAMTSGVHQHVISFVAHGAQVDVHRHHCFQIAVSLHAGFDCRLGDHVYHDMKGFVIDQNIPHSCAAQGTSVLIYFVDAESRLGRRLKAMLRGTSVLDLEPSLFPGQRARYFALKNASLPVLRLRQLAAEILDAIVASTAPPSEPILDRRIAGALVWIEARLSDRLTVHDLADRLCLSPERARHLFVQHTGVPFSQFMLWNRLKRVIALTVRDGRSLTEAALSSGFADQPHFCRVFRRMFGIPARLLLKNSRFVQFLNPPTW